MTRPTITNVQALRALAAMFVVAIHARPIFPTVPYLRFWESGVDLFFVISGFLMIYTTADGVTPMSFFRQRLLRVAPLYWIVTVVVFALALAVPGLIGATRADLPDLIKSIAFVPFHKGSAGTYPVVFVGWTLNYEMAFYALFALSLFIPRWGQWLLLAILAAAALSGPWAHGTLATFYSNPIVLEFAAGMVVAMAVERRFVRASWGGGLMALGIVAVGVGSLTEAHRALAFGPGCALIVLGAVLLDRAGRSFAPPWVLALGNASYAIYLTHFFVTQAVLKLAGLAAPPPLGRAVLYGLSFLLCAALGYAVHSLIERRLTRGLRGMFAPSASPHGPRRLPVKAVSVLKQS